MLLILGGIVMSEKYYILTFEVQDYSLLTIKSYFNFRFKTFKINIYEIYIKIYVQ